MVKKVVQVDVSKVLHMTMAEAASTVGISHSALRYAWRWQRYGQKWPGKAIRGKMKNQYKQPARVLRQEAELKAMTGEPCMLSVVIDQPDAVSPQ